MNIKTAIWRSFNLKFSFLMSMLAVLGSLGFVLPAAAESIASGFQAKGSLNPGMVVALTKNAQNTVESAPAADTSRIYGVVIDPSDAPLIINRVTGDQVFVANSGTYKVYISTERGEVREGDYISVSSTDGIAAKANYSQNMILGQALTSFDGKSDSITKIAGFPVAKISVSINPRKNPLVKNDVLIPTFLRKLGDSIAGKPVSPIHIYLALALLMSAVVISSSLLTAGVRGGMIALGRNPLNKGSIMNNMFKVVSAASLIFVIGLAGVYLLLKI